MARVPTSWHGTSIKILFRLSHFLDAGKKIISLECVEERRCERQAWLHSLLRHKENEWIKAEYGDSGDLLVPFDV